MLGETPGWIDSNQAALLSTDSECVAEPTGTREHVRLFAVTPSAVTHSGGTQVRVRDLNDRLRYGLHLLRCGRLPPAASANLESALLHCLVSETEARQPARSDAVDRARALLNAHLYRRWKLAEVATIVNLTPKYLTTEFSRALGMPMYQYQLRLRLNQALLDLPESANITELALALGFSSHSHFTVAFNAVFGASPSSYLAAAGGRRR